MSATQPPVTARPAATVLLLRDTEAGLEVFLQRRVKAMAFAASMTVFPGGGVDERDQAVGEAAWSGPPPSWWAARLGCPEPLATALVGAAVRETFEECGVLLAGAPDGSPLETDADLLATARDDLAARRASLAETLTAHGWTLRADLLRPWSNWITPEAEPRRYDTRFFVAGLPYGQRADDGTTEVSEAGWWRPVDALDAWRGERIKMLPPTWISLEQIAELPDVAAALAAADQRTITPLVPELRKDGDDVTIVLPDGLGYDSEPIRLRSRETPSTSPSTSTAPSTPAALPSPAAPRSAPRGLLDERPEHPAYETPRAVTSSASVLLVKNPSPMTLEGTNTWLLRAPGAEQVVVVDPGPLDEGHLRRVAEYGPVAQILLTHRHPDHAEGAARLAELTRAPVRALDPSLVLGGEGLAEGDVVAAAGLELRVLATPGHTSDSLCFVLDDAVLTGDTVLGRGTTVIAHPDGRLGDYLGSLRRLVELGDSLGDALAVLPGHGPELADAGAVAREYLAHREERLEQVRAALATLGPEATAMAVVELVYADVDRALWPAAEWSVRAQLDYLREQD